MSAPLPSTMARKIVIPLLVRQMARDMRRELITSRKLVILIPAPKPKFEGHQIRSVVEENPDWYRQFMALHTWMRTNKKGERRQQCSYDRCHILRSLARIAGGTGFRIKDSIDQKVHPFIVAEYEKHSAPF